MPIKECSLYTFTVNGTQTKTTPKDITARAAAEAAQNTANGKQDALTAAQLAAVNSGITADFVTKKFAVVTGTTPSAAGYSEVVPYPDGFTINNCVIIGLQLFSGSEWRYPGDGVYSTTSRCFTRLRTAGIDVYTTGSFSQPWKVTLMRTDI